VWGTLAQIIENDGAEKERRVFFVFEFLTISAKIEGYNFELAVSKVLV